MADEIGRAWPAGAFLLEPAIPRARDDEANRCHGVEEGSTACLGRADLHGMEWQRLAYLWMKRGVAGGRKPLPQLWNGESRNGKVGRKRDTSRLRQDALFPLPLAKNLVPIPCDFLRAVGCLVEV